MGYDGTIIVNGVNYGHRLPRGRHGIPPELVIANQRERLLKAATTVFATQGYASLAVRNVIEQAGVSRATFYKIFEGKVELVVAAQQRAFDGLREAMLASCASRQDWPGGVSSAVGTALDFVGQHPAEARLLLASSHALSEPELAREGLAVQQRLIELLHAGSQSYPSARSPRELTVRAAVGAAMSIVANCMAAEELEGLADLRADLVQIILTPYVGANEAKRVAQDA